jgi:tRNA(fMet)-specific endonuclease VapC
MAYLLDTNAMSSLVREPAGRVAQRIRDIGIEPVMTSAIVAAELRFGVIRRGSPRLADQVEDVLARFRIVPFEPPADEHYGVIRSRLERAGTPIGALDTLIAAHALALGHTLVTDNVREFSRIEGLGVENWLR